MTEVDTLILGGTILCLDDHMTRIDDGALAIAGDTLVALGTQDELRGRFTSRNIIDGTKTLIMPGLINSHTHAAMTCFRGIADDMNLMDWLNHYIFPAEARNVNPELAYWGSLLACAEMIKSGTTSAGSAASHCRNCSNSSGFSLCAPLGPRLPGSSPSSPWA